MTRAQPKEAREIRGIYPGVSRPVLSRKAERISGSLKRKKAEGITKSQVLTKPQQLLILPRSITRVLSPLIPVVPGR
jgi:hypothetical protein